MAVTLTTTGESAGKRLDVFLQEQMPAYSRSRLQDWIKDGRVRVDGVPGRASLKLRAGETVEVEPAALAPLHAFAEDLPLDILYEDNDVVAVNKPAGMVVHAGAGCHSGTLVNALLHHFGSLSTAGGDERPGIVHRLDRLTSGVILVARNDAAHRSLAEQFSSRRVEKLYLTLVHGAMPQETGRIERPIARDPVRRVKMTARLAEGRRAITEYRVLERFQGFTYLEVKIKTGRTHQIRVHFSSLGHPVAGDRLYGAPGLEADELGRFFLHSHRIRFEQPKTGEPVTVEAPLASELTAWMKKLTRI